MDTITHTLFGLTIYGAIKKDGMDKNVKKSLLMTAVVGSLIPDIDIVSKWWDTAGMYQMWHRGITHSIFLVPLWAALLMGACYLFWKVKDRRILYIGLLSVFIHNTSDLFNAWGTGYLEPFSSMRISFGTISIVDFTVWAVMLAGWLLTKFAKLAPHKAYRIVWLLIALHFGNQTIQGALLLQSTADQYEQQALAADFIPMHYQIIGKSGDTIQISKASVWRKPELLYSLTSSEDADLNYLFSNNPRAETLYAWSPFVVVEDRSDRIAIYDPRFYRNGQSFLMEYALK